MTSPLGRALASLWLLFLGLPALAVTCEDITFDGADFTICRVDATQEDLRLFLNDPSGAPYGYFSTLASDLDTRGLRLDFAMNAGMYHDDRSPVGHYIEDGRELMRVIPNAGPGNFGLLPNGIFCIRDTRADVIETKTYLETSGGCTHATQSGPMLVIDGALHPRFLVDSTSRYVRNGVGTRNEGREILFAISREPVTFHLFGRLFRDALDTPNALFLDGNVSRMFSRDRLSVELGRQLGPIVGVVSRQ